MSTVAKSLGKGASFEFEGETYTISPWNYDIQAEYEKHVISRAYANLRAARQELNEDYSEALNGLRRDIDAGEYEFGSPLVMKTTNSVKNFKYLLYLCLSYSHKDGSKSVTKELVEKISKEPNKLKEASELMYEANRDSDPKEVPAKTPGE